MMNQSFRNTRFKVVLPAGLFLLAGLLILAFTVPQTGAQDKEATGCPYLSKASGHGCPYMAKAKASGCPHIAAMKGPGCPYLKASKGCLHALKYSLELDEQQTESLREIQEKFMEESADLKKRIHDTGSSLDAMFRDSNVSAEAIEAERRELAGLKEELDRMAMGLRLQIREDLTEEQLRSIPEGCWHGILAYGYGDVWSCQKGMKGCRCPYMNEPSDADASA
jgi:hypothetical protein